VSAPAIGIEFLSGFGMPPVDFIHHAADLGCGHVSLGLAPFSFNPLNYPAWSLLEDESLRRDVRRALNDRGVRITLGEGVLIRPGVDIADSKRQIAALCELGAEGVNVVPLEPERARCFDQLAAFASLTRELGAAPMMEFGPLFSIPDLPTALAAAEQCGDLRLVLDALHFARSGAKVADLAAAAPAIGYVQLCDGPLKADRETYLNEARFERLAPSEGEFPLAEMVALLPGERVWALELPMLAKALGGAGPAERLASAVAAARNLLKG
jgi:sugar phosphate isomerase/epimerase